MRVSFPGRGGFLALFFLLALSNCGGGGGGGDDGGGGVVADFAPNCLTTDACFNNSVTLQKGTASGNIVSVQAVLNKLSTTIGEASLLVGFDPTVADFQGWTAGPALGTPAQLTTYVVTELNGEVVVDIAPAVGKSVTNAQVMITLTFKALKVGDTALTLKNPDTLNGSALYRPDASIIILGASGWTGGILSGT